MTIRIVIVDERPLYRAGLAHCLEERFGAEVAGQADSANDALRLVRHYDVDLLVISMHHALDCLKALREKHEEAAVLVVADDADGDLAAQAVRMGARGVLDVRATPEDLVEAVRTVTGGRRHLSAKLEDALVASHERRDRAAHELLSEREFQVFMKLARGSTAGDVARELSLSVKTVGTYRDRMMEKMGLKSNSELTYYALKNGLLQ